MKGSELRELTLEELAQKERELRREVFNLKFQLATAQIENPMKIRLLRKDLARVKTILRESELKEKLKAQEKQSEEQ